MPQATKAKHRRRGLLYPIKPKPGLIGPQPAVHKRIGQVPDDGKIESCPIKKGGIAAAQPLEGRREILL